MQTDTTTAPSAHTISRRALLKAAPAGAIALAVPAAAMALALPATAVAIGADAAILTAWQRRQAAYLAYNALPDDRWGGPVYTAEETHLWGIIDAAEDVIRATVATTPAGAAIQLWTQLSHNVTQREDEAATHRRDLAYFEAQGDQLDWTERLTVAALRSLAAMGAA